MSTSRKTTKTNPNSNPSTMISVVPSNPKSSPSFDPSICNLCIRKEMPQQTDSTIYNVSSSYFNRITNVKPEDTHYNHSTNRVFLLRSNKLIDPNIGRQLTKLIKPLQSNPYNYRDPKFIQSKSYPHDDKNKPKLQEIICQFQNYRQYKQLDVSMKKLAKIKARKERANRPFAMRSANTISPQHPVFQPLHPSWNAGSHFAFRADSSAQMTEDPEEWHYAEADLELGQLLSANKDSLMSDMTVVIDKDDTEHMNGIDDTDMPISFCPAIFSLKEYKFMTEINGLLYKKNVALYALIENVFIKMLNMFSWLFHRDGIDKHDELSVIVKIQDYIFEHEDEIKGRWHKEGDDEDDIIAVGLYYFDITCTENGN